MSVDIVVPRLAESISDAVLVEWLKGDGEAVAVDEPVATLETDKAAVEIAATASGVLRQKRKPGDQVHVGDVLGAVEEGAAPQPAAKAGGAARGGDGAAPSARETAPAREAPPAGTPSRGAARAAAGGERAAEPPAAGAEREAKAPAAGDVRKGPAVRRMVEEHGLDPAAVEASGRGGRLLKEDVQRHLDRAADPPEAAPAREPREAAPATGGERAVVREEPPAPRAAAAPARRGERVVPLSRIRLRIAERLVKAQHTAAILTTFNEIDMSAVMALRARHKDAFEKAHGVKLGFMSFFARAVVLALEEIPAVNAEIRGTDMVHPDGVHLGIAVGTPRGLVVPVVKDADRLDFAGLEGEIARLAGKGRDGTLTPEELSGGTFTISNGGVYGSLLSTPILNPPQSGILGMHKIEKRPVALDDQVVIRPMMYVALSYDHRIVDGEQAVTFLVRVKERIEDPERMLLGV